MAGFEIRQDNRKEFLKAMNQQVCNALEICAGKAETYAKRDCPVDMGTLRNSITHVVDTAEQKAYIGTNVEYAPYVELGTGIWNSGGRRDPWVFKDSKGNWHRTNGQKAQPYLKPAVNDHQSEYKHIIKSTIEGN